MVNNIKTVKYWRFWIGFDFLETLENRKMQSAVMYKNNLPNADTAVPKLGDRAIKYRSKSLKFRCESARLGLAMGGGLVIGSGYFAV